MRCKFIGTPRGILRKGLFFNVLTQIDNNKINAIIMGDNAGQVLSEDYNSVEDFLKDWINEV